MMHARLRVLPRSLFSQRIPGLNISLEAGGRFIMPVDKASFTDAMPLVALRVPKQRCQELMRKFKG